MRAARTTTAGTPQGTRSATSRPTTGAAARVRWWLDIETANTWSTTVALNNADIQGMVDFFAVRPCRSACTRLDSSGIRSRVDCPWRCRTGSPARRRSAQAVDWCTTASSFSGGPVTVRPVRDLVRSTPMSPAERPGEVVEVSDMIEKGLRMARCAARRRRPTAWSCRIVVGCALAVTLVGLLAVAVPAGADPGASTSPPATTPSTDAPQAVSPTGGSASRPEHKVDVSDGRSGQRSRACARGEQSGLGLRAPRATAAASTASVSRRAPRRSTSCSGARSGGRRRSACDGYVHLTGDPQGMAPRLQALFSGLGTNGETWSGVMTQYCEGVSVGATSCPANSAHVGYPTSVPLAGVWVDTAAAAPTQATDHQIGVEALNGVAHFGNTTASSNRNAQYVVVSPTGTHPGGFNTPNGNFCAWHDYNGDSHPRRRCDRLALRRLRVHEPCRTSPTWGRAAARTSSTPAAAARSTASRSSRATSTPRRSPTRTPPAAGPTRGVRERRQVRVDRRHGTRRRTQRRRSRRARSRCRRRTRTTRARA